MVMMMKRRKMMVRMAMMRVMVMVTMVMMVMAMMMTRRGWVWTVKSCMKLSNTSGLVRMSHSCTIIIKQFYTNIWFKFTNMSIQIETESTHVHIFGNAKYKMQIHTSGVCEGHARWEGLTVNLFTHKLTHYIMMTMTTMVVVLMMIMVKVSLSQICTPPLGTLPK